MGCDIHGVIQVRRIDGTWGTHDKINPARFYEAFSYVAGVRGPHLGYFSGRKFPADFNPDDPLHADEFDAFRYEGHSETWFSLLELQKILLKEREFEPNVWNVDEGSLQNQLETLFKITGPMWRDAEIYRFVFWFDS